MARRKNSAAWEEFLELCEEVGGEGLTMEVQKRMGMEAMAELRYQAQRGDTKACMYIVDRWLGQPEQPFAVKAQTMTAEEAQAALVVECRKLGWTDEQIEEMLAQVRGQE